jgi:hypothetical protein
MLSSLADRIYESHTGGNIAESAIISELNLENCLGYFVLDNASNNDTCIQTLSEELGPLKWFLGIRVISPNVYGFGACILELLHAS